MILFNLPSFYKSQPWYKMEIMEQPFSPFLGKIRKEIGKVASLVPGTWQMQSIVTVITIMVVYCYSLQYLSGHVD